MARVKGAMMTRKRRNKTLKLAKSYWGSKSRHFKMAKQAVAKSGVYAYVGRKLKKREFRQLWISRISAAVAPYGINYSRFMNGLKKSGIEMNRKALSELAIAYEEAFKVLVETAKKAILNFKKQRSDPARYRSFFCRKKRPEALPSGACFLGNYFFASVSRTLLAIAFASRPYFARSFL